MKTSKTGRQDYWHFGFFYIQKSFALTVIILACLAVIGTLRLPLDRIIPRYQYGVRVYSFDDPRLLKTDAQVCIADSKGNIRYFGYVLNGHCTGMGTVYNQNGETVYNGLMQEEP